MPSALPPQFLPPNHPNDPTETTLEQPAATVTQETIDAAAAARIGEPDA
jgi:hypothetical protein